MDITTQQDIKDFVDAFYGKIQQDELLGPVFGQRITATEWPRHLERMYSFWGTVLFGQGSYRGNPFAKHANLPVVAAHFQRWTHLLNEVIDERFAGEKAEEVKWRAQKMAEMFQIKLKHLRQHKDFRPLI